MPDGIGNFLASLTAFDWATIATLRDSLSVDVTHCQRDAVQLLAMQYGDILYDDIQWYRTDSGRVDRRTNK